ANAALALLHGSDYALEEMTKVLHRLSALAVQGGNGSYENISFEQIAKEVEELRKHLYQIANTTQENTFLFSGQRSNKPAYSITPNPPAPDLITFEGISDPLIAEVGAGITMEITVTGDRVFGDFFDKLAGFIEHLRTG